MQQRFLLEILLLVQHVSGTTMPIIRSSRVLYSDCCLWYIVLWFSSCWFGVELRVMCPVCRMLLNTFRARLCPSSGAQEYYTVVAACGISCCGFQVAGLVWSRGLCVRFVGCCPILHIFRRTSSFVMSVCPHGTTRLPLDGLSRNLIFQYFLKTCRED